MVLMSSERTLTREMRLFPGRQWRGKKRGKEENGGAAVVCLVVVTTAVAGSEWGRCCMWSLGRWRWRRWREGGRLTGNYRGPPVREKGVVVLCFGGDVVVFPVV
ncbi:hypothetical protein HAX54_046784 [Datura stramonium]|uniref:Uncharacterized protein n=1 Tax=Datura stramonium TaxID=4076 RepID=A0ABS8SRT8_DATST|nr:hypothetical protein [Datura stramonium]